MKNGESNITPPKLARLLLKIMLRSGSSHFALGDLTESYIYKLKQSGAFRARLWFWFEVIYALPGFIRNSFYWGIIMFRNYMLIAFRNFKNNTGYSFINIAGLATGMACFILISLWVQHELSYDNFHDDIGSIYRVVDYEQYSNGEEFRFSSNPAGLAPALKDDFPEIVEAVRFARAGSRVVKYKDKSFNEQYVSFTDPEFLTLFSFPLVKGNKENVLSDINSMVITEEMANKYFGDEDPVGKILRLDNAVDYKVSGVLAQPPKNTHFRFDFIAPFLSIKNFGRPVEGWNSYYINTYVKIHSETDPSQLNEKIKYAINKYDEQSIVELSLQPLEDIHLKSGTIGGMGGTGDIKYVYIFSIIAGFILITACINFMNLSTARSGKRAREVGLRKVVGSGRRELIGQFLTESTIYAFLSLLAAIILVILLLPHFNSLAGKDLSFNPAANSEISWILLATVIFTGIISGSYPALFLSSFKPAKVLSGSPYSGQSGKIFRKVLVSFQFILTISLIAGTFIIKDQLKFIRNQKLGYNKDAVVCIKLKGDLNQKTDILNNELKSVKNVINSTAVSDLPSSVRTSFIVREWEGSEPNSQILAHLLRADYEFVNTLGLQMASGRYYSRDFLSDTSDGIVINEAAAKVAGIDSPIGKSFLDRKIIGVIKDFHFESLHEKISPLVVAFVPERTSNLMVKINTLNITSTLEAMEEKWTEAAPGFPFEHRFLDEYIEEEYAADQRIEDIINAFTYLIVFIACLGLFGLAAYTAEQRKKEVGIRKVLGSSVTSIIMLLSKEFIRWVILANVFAWPIAYFIMNKWLEGFAYRTEIDLWIFFLSGATALLISLLTVIYQAVKAALSNPVDSLRRE